MSSQPGAPKPALERLAGLVERVTFHNADTGFCVLRLKVKGEASDFLFCFSGYAGSHRTEDCKTGEDAAASKNPTGASARYSGDVSDESQHHRHAQSERFVARCVEYAERIQRREIWSAIQHKQQSDAD